MIADYIFLKSNNPQTFVQVQNFELPNFQTIVQNIRNISLSDHEPVLTKIYLIAWNEQEMKHIIILVFITHFSLWLTSDITHSGAVIELFFKGKGEGELWICLENVKLRTDIKLLCSIEEYFFYFLFHHKIWIVDLGHHI